MRKFRELMSIMIVSVLIVGAAYFGMSTGPFVGLIVFGLGTVPLIGALLHRMDLRRLVPDMIFGSIDTGMLAIFGLLGGHLFGVIGAVVGGVVGDAITDGIAGFFEGGIAEWLRSKGIEESRVPLSSGLGKMSGCLLGCGAVLIAATVLGVGVESIAL